MVEKDVIVRDTKLKYTGFFDFDRVYKKVLEWLQREGYGTPESVEKSYLERVMTGGKQIEVVMVGKKTEAGYFRLELDLKLFGKKVTDAETVIDGNKVKIQKGDLDLQFASTLVWNVNKENKDVFAEMSMAKRFYEHFLVRDKIEDMKIELYKDTTKFIEEMKEFLNLYQL